MQNRSFESIAAECKSLEQLIADEYDSSVRNALIDQLNRLSAELYSQPMPAPAMASANDLYFDDFDLEPVELAA